MADVCFFGVSDDEKTTIREALHMDEISTNDDKQVSSCLHVKKVIIVGHGKKDLLQAQMEAIEERSPALVKVDDLIDREPVSLLPFERHYSLLTSRSEDFKIGRPDMAPSWGVPKHVAHRNFYSNRR